MAPGLLYTGPDLKDLHEQVAKAGGIDTRAPVFAEAECHIDATPAQVWQVLADVAHWPRVISAVRSVVLDSSVAVDRTFTWNNGGTRIASTFAIVDTERELTWTGRAVGTRAVHRNVLRATTTGTTLISQESMSGLLLPLFFPSSKLHKGLTDFVVDIAKAAEALAHT